MPVIIPMEITVHIVKHTSQVDNRVSHRAILTIGSPKLALDANSEEVFWCSATGRSLFACVTALKERTLAWAETYGIPLIAGLSDNEPCPLILKVGDPMAEGETHIVPVIYNDWVLDSWTGEPDV